MLGDGWMPYLYSPRRYAASVETIGACATEQGRDLAGFSWYVYLFVSVDPDGSSARTRMATSLGGNYSQDFTAMVDRVAAAGTTAEVTDQVLEFVEAGARHFVFMPVGSPNDRRACIERLIDGVLPAVRRRAG